MQRKSVVNPPHFTPDRFPALRFDTSPQTDVSTYNRNLRPQVMGAAPFTVRPSAAAWVAAIEAGQSQQLVQYVRSMGTAWLRDLRTEEGVPLLIDVATHVRHLGHLHKLLRLLLDNGALPTVLNARGDDALMVLLRSLDNPVQAIALLLRCGADVHHRNAEGQTALHLLLQKTHRHKLSMLRMLVERGVDLFYPTREGTMPLWLAACGPNGQPLVQAIVEACAPGHVRTMVRLSIERHGRTLGNPGVGALMYNIDDASCEGVLLVLARAGLDLDETQATASALAQDGAIGRSEAAIKARCQAVQARLSSESLSLSPPKFQIPKLPQPPTQIAAPDHHGYRPLSPLFPAQNARPFALSVPASPPQSASHVKLIAPPALSFSDERTPHAHRLHALAPPPLMPPIGRTPGVLSLHEAVHFGPVQAIEAAIAAQPEALSRAKATHMGTRAPLTLAVLSLNIEHVEAVLRGMRQHHLLISSVLDAAGEDGITALSAAIDTGGLAQTEQLLQAGASPLLPVLQSPRGMAKMLRGVPTILCENAAAFAVLRRQPHILRCLLDWDELQAEQLRSHFAFDLHALLALTLAKHHNSDSFVVREVLNAAMARRGSIGLH